MKTSTKIRICLCIILSLFLLAVIGKKTRENFENSKNNSDKDHPIQGLSSINNGNYRINPSDTPDFIHKHKESVVSCPGDTKTDMEKQAMVNSDAEQAKNKYALFLKNKMSKLNTTNTNTNNTKLGNNTSILGQDINDCYIKFPGLL